MSNTTRTDAHRPSTIIPADYVCRIWYSLAHEAEGFPQPAINIDDVIALHNEARAAGLAIFGTTGKCGVCGAHYKHGAVYTHEPTGQLVHMGYDCADKYEMMTDESAHELARDRVKSATAAAITRSRNEAERAEFLAVNPGLAEDLALTSTTRGGAILADLAAKFRTFRKMSPGQVALARKLANEIRNPAPAEIKATAPTGKGVTFTGEIVSAKLHESQYGATWKATIKVTTEAGVWLAWATVPANICDLAADSTEVRNARTQDYRRDAFARAIKGLVVDVSATLEPTTERRGECSYCNARGSVSDRDALEYGLKAGTCERCNGTGSWVKPADPSFVFAKRPVMSLAGLVLWPTRQDVKVKKPRAKKAAEIPA